MIQNCLNRGENSELTWESFERGFEKSWIKSQEINRKFGDSLPDYSEYMNSQQMAKNQEKKMKKARRNWKEKSKHPQYHNHMCCSEEDHLPVSRVVKITVPQNIAEKLHLKPVVNRKMSAEILTRMLEGTEKKTIGGALFDPRVKPYWLSILPYHCRAARWQRIGGADFLLRKVRQQPAVIPKEKGKEERELLESVIQPLMDQNVYEEVPQTLEEEEAHREYVRSGQWEIDLKKSRLSVVSTKTQQRASKSSTSKSKESNSNLIAFGSDLGKKEKRKREKKTTAMVNKRDMQVEQEQQAGVVAQIFYSEIWAKMEGEKARALADLKNSGGNKHTRPTKTKQDGVRDLKALVFPGCRFSLWDLRKAFFQVLLQARLRTMLRTWVQLRRKGAWKWVRIQNTGLSQGLAPSPEIITKLFADVLRVLRSMGFKCLIKVDDLVAVLPENIHDAMVQQYVISVVLIKLGAVVSGEKCDLNLRHRVLWHGLIFCSVVEVCSLPACKVTKVVQAIGMLMSQLLKRDGSVTMRMLQQVLGLIISTMEAVELVRSMCIELQELRAVLSGKPGWNWKDHGDEAVPVENIPQVKLKAAISGCRDWTLGYDNEQPEAIWWNGKLMYSETPVAVIYTDAAPWQAGVHVEADEENGYDKIELSFPFVGPEIGDHITKQETAAAADGVLEVLMRRGYRNCTVLVKIDATAAVKYLSCQGGRLADFARRVWDLVWYCKQWKICLIAGHIKGKLNVSDWKSRTCMGVAEYRMCRMLFLALEAKWGPFGLDACAAKWNHQLPRYISRQMGDKNSVGHNVLEYPLQQETQTLWIFPPPHMRLISEILQRINSAEAEAVMILPAWPHAATYEALAMATEMQVMLGCNAEILQPPLAYLPHGRVEQQGKPWYNQEQWKAFVGVRLPGKSKLRGVLAKNWQNARKTSIKSEPTDEEVRTMIDRSRSLWPASERCLEPTKSILRMLLFVT
jgi:hypothetical protein